MFKTSMTAAAALTMATAALAMPPMGNWSTPINLEALPGSATNLNTPAVDGCASLSQDGLSIAFTSNRTGDFDVYMAHRASTDVGFGPAEALPAPVNGPTWDACPSLLRGKRMMFTSFRDDPAGDLYETRLGPTGWSAPVRLGPNINTPGAQEEVASEYEDHLGRTVLLFTRRVGAPGDIYQSIDGGPATLVQGGVNSSASDLRASVTHDGRTIFWDSTRGNTGAPDIYMATRKSTRDVWGQAVLVADLGSIAQDLRPQISWDGTMMTLSSNRQPGTESPAPDIWYATREKAVGN